MLLIEDGFMYKYTDYFAQYGRIMQFNKNKFEPIHRWYPFVEGYSKEFIKSIIDETGKRSMVCLEPFSGSGTTALELQNMGVRCISFEVNPLMYLISRVKLYKYYNSKAVREQLQRVLNKAQRIKLTTVQSPFLTLYPKGNQDKWNIDLEVGIAVEKLRRAILFIAEEAYADLFMVALAAILLDVSNLYRNGKCLSYKENWKEVYLTQADVLKRFTDKVTEEIIPDIQRFEAITHTCECICNNYQLLYNEDCRTGIENYVEDNSIDLVITSPPYLNSRDYTDTYMLELKVLGFAKNLEEIKALRQKTLRSHVQLKWTDEAKVENVGLEATLNKLELASEGKSWNPSIINMVRLYFVDMQSVFHALAKKVKQGGKVFFNVSNSAYFGVEINTLEICAAIAENEGFSIIEIRKARYLKTSPQQKNTVSKLLEGVILMERRKDDE